MFSGSFRRFFGSAWTHRAAAFLAVAIGGGQVGAALRRLASSDLEYGLLGQTYLAGWLWRAGVSLSVLYDPEALRAAIAEIQSEGPVLSVPWLQPPALALLGWPLTPLSLAGARSAFLIAAVVLLLVGLVGFGWRRPGGWNRTDWLLLAGVILGSQGTMLALRDLEPTPLAFALGAWLLAATENRKHLLAGILALALAPLSGAAWIVLLCFALAGRWEETRTAGAGLVLGLVLAILSFGWTSHLAFLEALAGGSALPAIAAPSLPAQLRVLASASVPGAALISIVALGWGLGLLRRIPPLEHPLWRGLPVSWGLLLGALVLPAALPSRGLLAMAALWTAGRMAMEGQASSVRWMALAGAATLVVLPWPAPWLASLGLGTGAPIVAGEIGILLWLWRAASNPEIRRRAMEMKLEEPRARSAVATEASAGTSRASL